jgi:methylglutamate dehydrogenase subunit D
VVDQTLVARSAFAERATRNSAAISASIRDDLTIASLAAFNGQSDALKAAILKVYGLELPATPQRIAANDIAFVWSGPDQWIAIAEQGDGRDLEAELKPLLAGLAAVVDQSDGRAVVRVSGARARDVLAKGVPIDLHARVFKPGSVAITHASHIGVTLWQIDGTPTYELALARSFADSFMHALDQASAEFLIP